jgi:decaprenylphospho-beta-D-erythro-pentofuranosid-2-ulose 2-reductase
VTGKFNRAIIVGASSGIGAALARQLAAKGCRVALLARRAEELSTLADEINASYPGTDTRALTFPHDVLCYEEVPALFQTVCRDLGGLDLFIYASGVMPSVQQSEYNFEKDRRIIEVNVLGAIAWINEAAQRFEAAKEGTLVGISSVAGDRGRCGSPVYNTSKAAMDTYLEAIRNRIGRFGVQVVTIKPGPVETPMTAVLGKMPLMIPAADAARQIIVAAERGVRLAYIPWPWRFIMAIIRAIPSPIFKRMNV